MAAFYTGAVQPRRPLPHVPTGHGTASGTAGAELQVQSTLTRVTSLLRLAVTVSGQRELYVLLNVPGTHLRTDGNHRLSAQAQSRLTGGEGP